MKLITLTFLVTLLPTAAVTSSSDHSNDQSPSNSASDHSNGTPLSKGFAPNSNGLQPGNSKPLCNGPALNDVTNVMANSCRSPSNSHSASNDHTPSNLRSSPVTTKRSSSNREEISSSNHLYLRRRKRNFISTDPSFLYDKAIIPWHIDPNNTLPTPEDEEQLRAVMAFYEQKTCLNFAEIGTPATSGIQLAEHKYVKIGDYGNCSTSGIGRARTTDFTQVSLGTSCYTFGIVAHQLAHVIGLQHEHVRTDRDDYITVDLSKTFSENHVHFEKNANSSNLTPYDLGSLTHYGPLEFSYNGQDHTLASNDPDLAFLMGQRDSPSHYDLMAINIAYDCAKNCGTKTCENDAYLDKSCTCVCPYGLTGSDCTEMDENVSDEGCGGFYRLLNIDRHVNFTVSNITQSYHKCAWIFTSDYASWIELSFSDLNLPKFFDDLVEIRYNLPGQPGPKFNSVQFDLSRVFDTKTFRSPYRRPYVAVLLTAETGNGEELHLSGTATAKTDSLVTPPKHLAPKPYVTADFENGIAGFTQDGDLDFTLHMGKTPSQDTGPERASEGNFYAYLESSDGERRVSTAILTTQKTYEGDTPLCVDFDYHIYGEDLGELQVLMINESGFTQILWTRQQNNETWMNENLLIDPRPWPYRIQIKAITGYGYTSDVAVDNILIAEGPCRRITVEVDCKPCVTLSESRCNTTMTAQGLPYCSAYGWHESNALVWQTENCKVDALEYPSMGFSYLKTCGLARCLDMGIDYGLVYYQTKCRDVDGLNCQRCCIEDCDIDAGSSLAPWRILVLLMSMLLSMTFS